MNAHTTIAPVEAGSIRAFMEANGIASISLRVGRPLVVLTDGRAAAGPEVSIALEEARKPDAVRLS